MFLKVLYHSWDIWSIYLKDDILDDKKASCILYKMLGLNFGDHSNYHDLMEEIMARILAMKKVFMEYITRIS